MRAGEIAILHWCCFGGDHLGNYAQRLIVYGVAFLRTKTTAQPMSPIRCQRALGGSRKLRQLPLTRKPAVTYYNVLQQSIQISILASLSNV